MRILITHKSLHIERSLRIISKAFYDGDESSVGLKQIKNIKEESKDDE